MSQKTLRTSTKLTFCPKVAVYRQLSIHNWGLTLALNVYPFLASYKNTTKHLNTYSVIRGSKFPIHNRLSSITFSGSGSGKVTTFFSGWKILHINFINYILKSLNYTMHVYFTVHYRLASLNILVWRYTCSRLILEAKFTLQIYIL
jgi:hypothetical protein